MILLALLFSGCQKNAGSYTGTSVVDVCLNETCDYPADGQSDERQIRDAINAVISAGGGVVNINSGDYDIAGPITVSLAGADVIIKGAGNSTVLTSSMATTSGSLGYIFNISDTATSTLSNVVFEDISFVGSATSDRAVNIDTVHRAKFDNCSFSSFSVGYGVYTSSTTLLSVIDNYFTGNNSNVSINDSFTEATIITPGKYTEWNGSNFTTVTFASNKASSTNATSTSCCD